MKYTSGAQEYMDGTIVCHMMQLTYQERLDLRLPYCVIALGCTQWPDLRPAHMMLLTSYTKLQRPVPPTTPVMKVTRLIYLF